MKALVIGATAAMVRLVKSGRRATATVVAQDILKA